MTPSMAISRASSTPNSVPSMKFEKDASKNGSHVHRSGEPRVGRGSGAVSPSSSARERNIERRCSSYGSPDNRAARGSDVGFDPLKDPKTPARRLRRASTGPGAGPLVDLVFHRFGARLAPRSPAGWSPGDADVLDESTRRTRDMESVRHGH